MSLELRIEELTQAVKALTLAMTNTNSNNTAVTVEKPKKADKTEKVEKVEKADKGDTYLLAGDPKGTRYWHIAAHNTVFKQLPGMPDVTIAGAEIVSGAHFEKLQAELAERFPSAVPAAPAAPVAAPEPAPAPTPAPAAPAAPVAAPVAAAPLTVKEITERFQALVKSKGPAAMKAILSSFGVTNISALAEKAVPLDQVAAAIAEAAQ